MVWGHNDFLREVRRQLIELESLRRKLHEANDSPLRGSASFIESDSSAQARSAAEDSLEKIERSQQQLLRKLDELFAERASAPGSARSASESEPETVAHTEESKTQAQKLIECVRNLLSQPGLLEELLGRDEASVDDPALDEPVGADSSADKISTDKISTDIELEPLFDELDLGESIALGELFGDFKLEFDKFADIEISDLEISNPTGKSIQGVPEIDGGQHSDIASSAAEIGTEVVIQQRCCGCGKLIVSSVLAGEQVVQEGGEWFHESCCPSTDEETRFIWQPSVLN